jgi:hypothetical protein
MPSWVTEPLLPVRKKATVIDEFQKVQDITRHPGVSHNGGKY